MFRMANFAFLFIADLRCEHVPLALDLRVEDAVASCARPLIRGTQMRLKDKVAIGSLVLFLFDLLFLDGKNI